LAPTSAGIDQLNLTSLRIGTVTQPIRNRYVECKFADGRDKDAWIVVVYSSQKEYDGCKEARKVEAEKADTSCGGLWDTRT
jgi:hypothetical protein